MNREYLQAKADLCLNQAEKDLQQEEIARAIANLTQGKPPPCRNYSDFEEEESE
jgi:hypothetical protein